MAKQKQKQKQKHFVNKASKKNKQPNKSPENKQIDTLIRNIEMQNFPANFVPVEDLGIQFTHNSQNSDFKIKFTFKISDTKYRYFFNDIFKYICEKGKIDLAKELIKKLFKNFTTKNQKLPQLPKFTGDDFFALSNYLGICKSDRNSTVNSRNFIGHIELLLICIDECQKFFEKNKNIINNNNRKNNLTQTNSPTVVRSTQIEVQNPIQNFSQLDIRENAKFIYNSKNISKIELLPYTHTNGEKLQLTEKHSEDSIELILGLDFGTSSTKVVISNIAKPISYGIEFINSQNYQSYLLPTTIYETEGSFSLESGNKHHRNLKLNFLDDPKNINNQIRIVAYLALVMTRSRAYLYKNYQAELKGPKFLWQVNAGFAAKNLEKLESTKIYKRLIYIAWYFSTKIESITEENILSEIRDAQKSDDFSKSSSFYVEIQPEITAQIYAFLASTQFDPKARNHYMIVDVGAGTVDTAVFNVQQKNGVWNFSFFKANVEPIGVVRLHHNRIKWWIEQLKANNANKELIEQAEKLSLDTDNINQFPESYLDYYDGVIQPENEHLTKNNLSLNPDLYFYNNKFRKQVEAKTLFQVRTERQLDGNDIRNIPFYLCGGGSRMTLYRKIIQDLRTPHRGTTWLSAEYRELTKPEKLNAKNLETEQYDRLSVAYGLANMPFGKAVDATPLPPRIVNNELCDNFIGPEQT